MSIYITFIERESCFVRIWGQQDKSMALCIENALMQMKPQFDAGVGMLPANQLQPGVLCAAKFKDDAYYRAHIISVAMRAQGMVEVLFIDYGNRDLIQVANVRNIFSFGSLISPPPQAKDYILAHVQVGNAFPDPGFELIANDIRYLDFDCQLVGQVGPFGVLQLSAGGQEISRSFVERQAALPIDVAKQCLMLQSFVKLSTGQLVPIVGPTFSPPVGMMAHHQQRSPPMFIQQQGQMSPPVGGQLSLLTFKSLPLKVGSEHTIYVSYVTEGPCLFSIQLQNKEQELQDLMIELNKLSLSPIEENIIPGYVCLARSLEDNYICRAVVTNMVEDKYKVFFVDFGNTEVRSFDNLFQIPFKYVIPKVMATRFALNGLQAQVVTVDMKVAFKNFVDNKAMKMRVCPPLPNTGVPLCDIWNSEGISALDFVRGASLKAYPDPVPLSRGLSQEVKVSFVFSCARFYVQLRKKESELTEMMQKLQTAGMSALTPDLLKVHAPCIALYDADGMYYRAQVVSVDGANALVRYVDYGNEENIPVGNIRTPIAEFITNLRPQAIECCLNGYQNMESDPERDNLLEELMLEQYFSMKVVDIHGNRILVELMDAQMYNVASLLLDRMAKNRSQVSPALVQDNKIDHRKMTPMKSSPRETKADSWRENNRPVQQHRSPPSNDWRQKEASTESNNEFRKKVHSNFANRNSADGEAAPFQENRRQNTWSNRLQRENNSGGSDGRTPRNNLGDDKRAESNNWNENKRPPSWSGCDRRDNSRENSWGDGNRRDNFNRRENSFDRKDNSFERRENSFERKENSFERKDNSFERRAKNFEKRENSFERRENSWDTNKRPDREFKNRAPRAENENSWGGGDRRQRRDNRSEDGSEKSFNSAKSFKGKRDNHGGGSPKKNFDEIVDYAATCEQFSSVDVIGSEKNVVTSWFFNPGSFFLQLTDDKVAFDAIMKDIQFAYKRRTPLETASVGDSVIALFPEDRALYRATILEEPVGGNYKVNYVDFGNNGVTTKIYQVERRFMVLPAQALQCALVNVQPAGVQWAKAAAFGKYFGSSNLSCKFEAFSDNKYSVELMSNGSSVKEELQKAGLIIIKNPYEHFDITYLLSQQFNCKLNSVNSIDNFSLEILPGLIISCVVFKHEVASTPNLELLNSFVGHQLIAYVDDVQNNKAFVTLYDNCGKFLPVIELQEEMFETVSQICPAVVIGPRLSGYVAHATPTSLFVQPSVSAANVDVLLEQLYAFYEATQACDLEVKEVIYAVRSSDANWYRGLVKNINGDEITVQFIDYGNEEIVNKSVIRVLSSEFFIPHLVIEIEVLNAETYQDQEVHLNIHFGEEKWVGEVDEPPVKQPVTFSTQSARLSTQAVKIIPGEPTIVPESTGSQIETIPECMPEEYSASIEPEQEPLSGQYQSIGFSVELSHLDNPGQFYLQQTSALDAIAELQDVLQPQIDSLTDIDNVTTGVLCAAPYSADQIWYRAQVLDADTDITTVRFVDFGNTDVLGSEIKIKTLPTELLSLEEHAKRCSLHLSPKDSEWTSEACKRFEDLTTNVALTAEIVHQDEKTTFVRLYADSVCVNDVFLQENLAVELQAAPAALTGFVSNLNSPAEFWLQFEHACSDLEMIAEQLVNADKFKLLEDQAPGSLCAAIFPDDESWYRARILSNTVAGVEVLFIDYGNSCTCTSLRELPEDLVMLPALAHKCSLYKPEGLLEWSAKATEKLKEIAADGVTVFTVVKHSQGETNYVQLFFSNEDVSDILLPELTTFKMLNCNNLGDIALRKVDVEEKFSEIQCRIQELSDKPEASETIVAALYDCVFYRAKINGAIVDKFVVDLLDVGIEADVTELRQLPRDLIELEPLAMSAKMLPLVGYTFNSESESYFKTLCSTDELLFQVEIVEGKCVRLYQNGCDVREKMPATKCTPLNSLQNTPKKSKAVAVEKEILEEEILLTEIRSENDVFEKERNLEEEMKDVVNMLADNVPMISDNVPEVIKNLDKNAVTSETEDFQPGVIKSEADIIKPEQELPKSEVINSNLKIVSTETENQKMNKSLDADENETLLNDADMFTTVTDDLIDRVSKQCNLLKGLSPVTNVLTNGNNDVNDKADLDLEAATQKIEENSEEKNVS